MYHTFLHIWTTLFKFPVENNIITAKLQQYWLIGTASHPNMQKIRLIGLFFENRPHWQLEVEKKKILQTAVLGYIFIYVRKKNINTS